MITPDELIGLKNEVIFFAPDTNPLKLPLTSPTAYEQALAYDPPDRERHKVSEFIRRRGRTDQNRSEEPEEESQPRNKTWRNNKSKNQRRSENNNGRRSNNNNNNNHNNEHQTQDPKPSRQGNPADDTSPDYSD
ncbi:MAG: hypothetical protein IPP97_04205 [Candidatus Obscuribacter sp.]|nr:hypothetical protein [Candidatus Obscuribacter sp.]